MGDSFLDGPDVGDSVVGANEGLVDGDDVGIAWFKKIFNK